MVRLCDIRYVRLGTRQPDGTDRFLRSMLGLRLVRHARGVRYYASDEREHTRACFEGDPSEQTIGFELDGVDALDAAGAARTGR
jgi:2,3-dihydroxy-p-cumate/2,3-dihydroxybenzoate 3,4-dioxygenase